MATTCPRCGLPKIDCDALRDSDALACHVDNAPKPAPEPPPAPPEDVQ